MSTTGYLSPDYAVALAEFGHLIALPDSGGSLLVRTIPATSFQDAMGPYPLFCCSDWSALPADLANLAGRVVSMTLVTDPFGPAEPSTLAPAFSHGLVPYKDHSVIDLEVPLESSACAHHRRNARKALARLMVEEVADPRKYLDTWCGLYAELIRRHRLSGISRFSRESFAVQLAVPGLVAFRAVDDQGETVGMVLWYCQGDVGYYHLAAYSPRGYAQRASYGLFWVSAERLRGRVRWLSLGAGAGASESESETNDRRDGLTRFKRGWSALVRPTYLGRHVADPGRFTELSRGCAATDYFPAYRAPASAGA